MAIFSYFMFRMYVLTVEYRINIPRSIVSKIVHIPEAMVYEQTETH